MGDIVPSPQVPPSRLLVYVLVEMSAEGEEIDGDEVDEEGLLELEAGEIPAAGHGLGFDGS